MKGSLRCQQRYSRATFLTENYPIPPTALLHPHTRFQSTQEHGEGKTQKSRLAFLIQGLSGEILKPLDPLNSDH